MSEAGPSVDRPSTPTSVLAIPKPIYSRHDQSTIPNDTQPTIIRTPTDDRIGVQYSSRPPTVSDPTTVRFPESQTIPLSAAQPPSGDRAPTLPPPSQTIPVDPPGESSLQRRTTRERLLAFLGFGTDPELRDRKELRSLIWKLGFNGAQITAIVTLLAYSSEHSSPQDPDVSEWRACNKPLGLWNSLWAVKVGFDCLIVWWSYQRERASRAMNPTNADVEARAATPAHIGVNPPGTVRLDQVVPPRGTNETSSRQSQTNYRNNPNLPNSRLYSQLSFLLSILAFVWFITSNAFIYSSLDSCRLAAPHLWWLTFAMLTPIYLMLVELVLLALIIFVIGPTIFLFWKLAWIFLSICLPQHVLQNPDGIKPPVGKLSKAVVDKIPLVLYIPTPEDQGSTPIPIPPLAHTYPPASPKPKPVKRRFFFLRMKQPGASDLKQKGKTHGDSNSGDSWEDNWEKGDYPFVRLEDNRARCAICQTDFDEPRKVGANSGDHEKGEDTEAENTKDEAPRQQEGLKLEDAEEGPQPLRLLACGHAFHKICLDPWLTGVSGRCPTCQRPVEPEENEAKKRRNAQA